MLKTRTLVTVAALAVTFISPALHAQGRSLRSEAKIPFAFEVGNIHFGPGTYILSEPTRYVFFVQGTKRSALSMTMHEIGSTPAQHSELIFHRCGNRYFLREVWKTGDTDYLSFSASKAERELMAVQRATDHAALDTHTNVEVALLESPR
jgi:protease II